MRRKDPSPPTEGTGDARSLQEEQQAVSDRTLAELKPGERATVSGYANHGPLAQRMMQLGVLPGEHIENLRCAPGGDPLEFKVMGYALSLRKSEAALVRINATG